MMKKFITLLAVAALLFTLAPTAQAALIAPIGYDGPYRLAIVTTGQYVPGNVTALTIGDGYIQDSVDDVPALVALGNIGWQIIGSTATEDAKTHTNTDPDVDGAGVPIYTTDGLRVADGNAHLWGVTSTTSTWHYEPIDFDDGSDVVAWGTAAPNPNQRAIYTGTEPDGTAHSVSPFGATNTTMSRDINRAGTQWITDGTDRNDAKNLYGISGVIPEPATMSMLAIGGLALIRRRRRA